MIKLYNQDMDIIGKYKTITAVDGTLYVNKLTDEQLNSYGYYKVEYGSMPNRRYYTSTQTKGIVNGKYTVDYTQSDRPIEEVKNSMLKDLKESFDGYAERPRVDTGLGYFVDGGRKDLENFKIGKEFAFPQVKDADGIMRDVTDADYDTIILAIKTAGVSLYQTKWEKEAEIASLVTVADCIAYENTPYDYVITQADVDADIDGALIVGQIIVKYKNNVKEW